MTLEDLLDHALTKLILLAATLISLPLAWYLYRRGRRTRKPSWDVWNYKVVDRPSGEWESLELRYKDEAVPTVSVARLIVWNDGTDSISAEDMKTTSPLRVEMRNEARILDAYVLQTNALGSTFRPHIAKNRTDLLLEFDYMNSRQGAVLQILHTGRSESDVHVTGEIRGAEPVRRRRLQEVVVFPPLHMLGLFVPAGLRQRVRPQYRRRIVVLMNLGLALGAGAVAWDAYTRSGRVELLVVLVAGILMIAAAVNTTRSVPSGLDEFDPRG